MTYDGPRMDPVAVTMSMMTFIKYIKSIPEVGFLIDTQTAVKNLVPTNNIHYAKHAAEANGLQKEQSAEHTRPIRTEPAVYCPHHFTPRTWAWCPLSHARSTTNDAGIP